MPQQGIHIPWFHFRIICVLCSLDKSRGRLGMLQGGNLYLSGDCGKNSWAATLSLPARMYCRLSQYVSRYMNGQPNYYFLHYRLSDLLFSCPWLEITFHPLFKSRKSPANLIRSFILSLTVDQSNHSFFLVFVLVSHFIALNYRSHEYCVEELCTRTNTGWYQWSCAILSV